MNGAEQCQELAAYLAWADGRIWAAVADLPEALWRQALPASHGSLAGTVAHLLGAEWTWLERIQGRSPAQVGPPGDPGDRAAISRIWPAIWDGWRDAARDLDPSGVVHYRTTAGTPQDTPLLWVWMHVSHHSAQYRGQTAAILRHLEVVPPNTDLIAFLRGA